MLTVESPANSLRWFPRLVPTSIKDSSKQVVPARSVSVNVSRVRCRDGLG